ncbi:MAG: response regulator [Ignavibacteria bacterium]|nr:response regulator [Ignavibacteria bacterium]
MAKILVVDDDPNVNMFISRLLIKKFNCNVVSASNGLEALSKLKEEEPDVIFLDVTMPVMNGIETLEAIKADKKFSKMPVIMLTAVSERQVIEKVMGMGVLDYILKPLIYDAAYNRIKEIFDAIRKMKKDEEEILKKIGTAELNKEKILIVDKDKEFRTVFANEMKSSYNVIEAETGAEGLKLFMNELPSIVYLGENLPLLNEKLLAQKIRTIKNKEEVTLYTVRENPILNEEEKILFDYVIKKDKDNIEVFGKN